MTQAHSEPRGLRAALLLTLFFGRWVLPYRSSGKDGGGPSPLLARGAMGCGDAKSKRGAQVV